MLGIGFDVTWNARFRRTPVTPDRVTGRFWGEVLMGGMACVGRQPCEVKSSVGEPVSKALA